LARTAVQGRFGETRQSPDSFLRLVIPTFPALFRLEVKTRIWNARRIIHHFSGMLGPRRRRYEMGLKLALGLTLI
jgi:hypothetical protein